MKLIAFTGPKHIGKSTAANICARLVTYPARLSFAGPLKMALLSMGFTREELFIDKEAVVPDIGKSGRQLMQTLGTEWGRHLIHQDIWLKLFTRQMNLQQKSGTELVLVDDVRYDNEAAHIKKLGGTIIQITSTIRGDKLDSHSSEVGIDRSYVDHIVVNNGDMEEFTSDIKLLAIPILK